MKKIGAIGVCIFLNLAFACYAQNMSPGQPGLVRPLSNTTLLSTNANLSVTVTDPNADLLTVEYFLRPCPLPSGSDFTIIGISDTQYYTSQLNGGTNAMYKSQMNWIVNNRITENIVFAEGLGDCVQNGDNVENEWKRVDTCMKIIENPTTTGLAHGIPYGLNVGNHDQSPFGNAAGTTNFFNQYFGYSRFTGRSYYGGHYGTNNNNNFQLFSASGLDFIVINLEYNTSMSPALVSWIQNVLTTYSNIRAIIGSHYIINAAGQFGIQGQAIYNVVKHFPNVFLMLCGHLSEEGMRTDTYNGNVITTLLSDFQNRTNGGNGWFRLMKFSPVNNSIAVKTYSPWLNQYETDGNSQFTISYHMQSTAFTTIGSISNVASGNVSVLAVNNLQPNSCYEWYVKVSDGSLTTTSPVWKFTTGNNASPVSLNMKAYIEGFYVGNGIMNAVSDPAICDTITLEFRYPEKPYALAYSVPGTLNTSGNGSFSLPSSLYGNLYFLVLKHRNSIQTWSANSISFHSTSLSYDFTTAASMAYGNNLQDLKDGRFGVYSGDVDQNGFINLWDYLVIQHASKSFFRGYHPYDLTGNSLVESADYSISENNMNDSVSIKKPN